MTTQAPLSRRTALRGLGASIALPWLEAMLPKRACAAEAAPVTRAAFLYVPNGVHMPAWTPEGTGADFRWSPLLAPLKPFRNETLVLSGLALDPARPHGDGGGDHARAMAAFLTAAHPRKTSGRDLKAGISVDQLLAEKIGRATKFPSLELGCEGSSALGACDHGYSCAYQTNLSWRGDATPSPKEIDPRLIFERLFGGGRTRENDAARARRERDRKSVLDSVAEDTAHLKARLGTEDRRKLDEYATGLREVERRIALAQPAVEIGKGQLVRPLGIPAEFGEHARLMCDLLVLAFEADLTRVVSLAFANDGSNRSYPAIGVREGHHDVSHHGGDGAKQEKIRAINAFHLEQLTYLLGKLKSVAEGDGTLLDRSLILYGSGISDGNAHDHADLPILLLGRGNGQVKSGRHIRVTKETPLANLHRSILDAMGAPTTIFGDSTGRLSELI